MAEQPDVASVIGDPSTFSAFGSGSESKQEKPTAPESTDSIRRRVLGEAINTRLGGDLADLYKREEEASGRVKLAEAAKERDLAQRIAGAEGAYARGVRGAYAAAEPKLMAPPPKFNVTKESAEGMNALAVLMPIAGLIIGSKGMMSGVNAMNAMAGALEGYQKGNKERIDFETKKYEKAMEEWKIAINQVKDSLSRYEKLAATDLAAATSQAKAEAAAKGYGVVKDLIEQQGLTKTREIVERIATQTAAANARVASAQRRPIEVMGPDNRPALMDPVTKEFLTGPDGEILRPTRKASGAFAQQFEDLTAIATNEAALSAQALKTSPFATTGMFQGRNTSGLLNAPLGVLTNKLTSDSVQQYNVIMGNMGTNITKVLYGGRVVPVKVQEAFNNRFAVKEGDSPFTVLLKMADMRQTFERAIEVKLANPQISPELKEVYRKAEDEFKAAIPFTMKDVQDAQRAERERKGKKVPATFGDFMTKNLGQETTPATTKASPSVSKKSPEVRFSELEESGLSEDEIYNKLKEEGY